MPTPEPLRDERRPTIEERRRNIGEAACRHIDELVAAAPPFTERQRTKLAVLLRRPRSSTQSRVSGRLDAASAASELG